jgi:hypothetical protein
MTLGLALVCDNSSVAWVTVVPTRAAQAAQVHLYLAVSVIQGPSTNSHSIPTRLGERGMERLAPAKHCV